jgi:hypothetical protein
VIESYSIILSLSSLAQVEFLKVQLAPDSFLVWYVAILQVRCRRGFVFSFAEAGLLFVIVTHFGGFWCNEMDDCYRFFHTFLFIYRVMGVG